ncbi:MAG: hypothetical protein D3903_04840 [Candidatus Electrothrix sp. GM3_4]|nr:hypothetical protein [Candidatus Electrothrix sp. GM3_4]
MDALIQLIIFLTLLTLGYVFGKIAEKKHYRSIVEREKQWMQVPTTSGRRVLGTDREVKRVQLATGSVVISVDYFKRILAGLRNIFGGNVQSYETLVDRARREAVLRMKESCPKADQIINLRLETSSISKGNKNKIGSVEVLAYGTAVYLYPASTAAHRS